MLSHREEDFRVIRMIGKGSIGKVMLVQEKSTGKYYALKSIKKADLPTERQRKVALQERELFTQKIMKVESPFLVKLHASFQSPTHLFYVLEYYPGGDFATLLAQTTRLKEGAVQFYAGELVLGLEALHALKIVYRDLKPENVVMSREGHLVLVDFGLSKVLVGTDVCSLTKTFCGTAEYLAPEVLLSQPYGFAVDLWSLGTMLYEMLMGTPPYWADVPQLMYQKIVDAKPLNFPASVSAEAADLVTKLLRFEPKSRIGYQSMEAIKQHPFFAGVDWDAMHRLEIPAPAQPVIRSEEDVTAFDEAFTSMTPAITPADGCSLAYLHAFSGFTFCNDQAH